MVAQDVERQLRLDQDVRRPQVRVLVDGLIEDRQVESGVEAGMADQRVEQVEQERSDADDPGRLRRGGRDRCGVRSGTAASELAAGHRLHP